MGSIINQTYKIILNDINLEVKNLIIKKVLFGVNMTAIELSDSSIGIASTLFEKSTRPHKRQRYFGDFSPSKFSGQKIIDLFTSERESDLINTLKIAVLNALSAKQREEVGYKIYENTDPIDLVEITSGTNVTLVGAFRTYIDSLAETDVNLRVLELNENIFFDEHKKYFVPAEEYTKILPNSDIIIVTGLTLINNTIDDILKVANPDAKVIVVGPTANILPKVLFDHGVDIIGATKYFNQELLFKLISEGANAYHLFKYCATKISIVNE